jgi:hypothetical protein
VKTSGSPFKYLVLLLVKFQNLQGCTKEEIGKVLPFLAIEPPNHQNRANQNFLEPFFTQNYSHCKNIFLRGVAFDGTQKARPVCDL